MDQKTPISKTTDPTTSAPEEKPRSKVWWLVGSIVLLIIVVVVVYWYQRPAGLYQNNQNTSDTSTSTPTAASSDWTYGGITSHSDYGADADVVQLADGTYRLFYGQLPQAPTNGHSVLSMSSSDGLNWQDDSGVRVKDASFPDVVSLPDGRFRMYFQNGDNIMSAISDDGLNFTEESGVRVDATNKEGLAFTQVGAPTTMIQADGTFTMVYSGYLAEKYANDVPNDETHIFLWATSTDGLNFTEQGIAVDSRNDTYLGWVDGPDWSYWNDGWQLFFWGYAGVYQLSFAGQSFGQGKLVYQGETTDNNPLVKFNPNPPGDPSVIKIGTTWYMYYGSYQEGKNVLYYATNTAN